MNSAEYLSSSYSSDENISPTRKQGVGQRLFETSGHKRAFRETSMVGSYPKLEASILERSETFRGKRVLKQLIPASINQNHYANE